MDKDIMLGFTVTVFVLSQTFLYEFNYFLSQITGLTFIVYILPVIMEAMFLTHIRKNSNGIDDKFLYCIFLGSTINYMYMFLMCIKYDYKEISVDMLHAAQTSSDSIEYYMGIIVLIVCMNKLYRAYSSNRL